MVKGKLESVNGLLDGGYLITIRAAMNPHILELVGKDVVFEVKKDRKRRSLDANGYYWILVDKLAEAMRVSKTRMHNTLLRKYGQRFIVDESPVGIMLPDTEEAENEAFELETVHLRPTSQVKEGKDGKTYRAYYVLRGSSDYDSWEMSILIDGTISDCQDVGIETMTPDELLRLKGYEKQAFKTV